jgi:3-methyladenine DNA glycosylase AlkD
MPARAPTVASSTRAPPRRASGTPEGTPEARARFALDWLRAHASESTREGMARYAIPSEHALGVGMKDIQALAKQLGRDHALAGALWDTGVYEARMLAAYVAEPERLAAAQMDRWCRDFDNWAVCDTLCFVLFDRSPHAWRKVQQWSSRRGEMQKRAAFALLASLALHGRLQDQAQRAMGLMLVERESTDERNFVRKGVSWALRSLGRREDGRRDALALARRLAASDDASARWIGKDALRDLTKVRPAKKVTTSRKRQAAS